MKMTEEQTYKSYNDYLDELQPLDGVHCNPFSQLLEAGDPTAYNLGFNDYCLGQGIEIES